MPTYKIGYPFKPQVMTYSESDQRELRDDHVVWEACGRFVGIPVFAVDNFNKFPTVNPPALEDEKPLGFVVSPIEYSFDQGKLLLNVEANQECFIEKSEVKVGWFTDLERTPGTWNGQEYDVKQTNLVPRFVMVLKSQCFAAL